ncbi:hypothetical protein MAQ5080_02552 [Marinomonas aquimarina]|uniref:DUF2474 domain-containing protein n=1 Tax=Marinomonas aquimarina TaxID=295068 RepID=A0A1A8TI59_9GAMM|nr:hypothetical protein MAQ5080_02552 [Marinomonas aquimarina]
MKTARKTLKSWQWFVLLYLLGFIGLTLLAYSLKFLINSVF